VRGAPRRAAQAWAAAGDMDEIADHSGAKAVARRRHGRVLLPSVGGRAIRLSLAEHPRTRGEGAYLIS
jgi:hypothetical protein